MASNAAQLRGVADEELVRRAIAAFEEHKVMVAGRYIEALQARGRDPEKLAASLEARGAVPEATRLVARLRHVHGRVSKLRASLASDAGWGVQRDSGDTRVLYQAHASGCLRIRVDTQVDAPLYDLLALLREVQLWHKWIPSLGGLGLSEAEELGRTSILNMCFRARIALPWPIQDRVCTFAVDGVDCMNAEDAPQQVLVLLDSGDAQQSCPFSLEARPIKGKFVALEMIESGIIITPAEVAGTAHTLFQIIAVVDPKMFVPKWLVNLAIRNLCFLIAVQIQRAAAVTRKPAHLARTTDPENSFYAFIRRRMAESLPTQLALAPPLRGRGCATEQPADDSPAGCWRAASLGSSSFWATGSCFGGREGRSRRSAGSTDVHDRASPADAALPSAALAPQIDEGVRAQRSPGIQKILGSSWARYGGIMAVLLAIVASMQLVQPGSPALSELAAAF